MCQLWCENNIYIFSHKINSLTVERWCVENIYIFYRKWKKRWNYLVVENDEKKSGLKDQMIRRVRAKSRIIQIFPKR